MYILLLLTKVEKYSNKSNKHTITIQLNDGVKSGKVNFEVTNLWIAPNKGLSYSYDI